MITEELEIRAKMAAEKMEEENRESIRLEKKGFTQFVVGDENFPKGMPIAKITGGKKDYYLYHLMF